MTKIEWTDRTWNPLVGCSIVSPGCTNCYAMKMAARLEAMAQAQLNRSKAGDTIATAHYLGTTKPSKAGAVWSGKVARAPDHTLLEPLQRKRPTMYFVNSMSDLFHEDVPDEWIDRVFAVMMYAQQHTFQVLTKRSSRMRAYMTNPRTSERVHGLWEAGWQDGDPGSFDWPANNVWLGVSAERQKEADERIPDLLATPAIVRFVSAEPLLGPIDFQRIDWNGSTALCALDQPGIGWVIVGGESGLGARPMHPDWVRSIRDQCAETGTPFFFKQWGSFRPLIDRERHDPDWRLDYTNQYADCGNFRWLNLNGGRGFHGDRFHVMQKVGKRIAGRLLDDREWNEMPGASKYDQSPTDPHHGGKVSA